MTDHVAALIERTNAELERCRLAPAELAERRAVILEATTWLRTPYADWGNAKGAAIDCAMLLVRCWVDTGIIPPIDPRPYPPQWHLHRKEERYLEWLTQKVGAVETASPKPGDIVLFRVGKTLAHGAILVGSGQMIHAFKKDRMCSISALGQAEFVGRDRRFFDVWAGRRAAAA